MGLGLLHAGFEINWACDFDPHCVKTYKQNIGDWVVQADVTKLTYQDIPKADGWAFGFPCQDLSISGKQAGFVLCCNHCKTEWKHTESESGSPKCPECGSESYTAATRSACFFEIMRLLDETKENNPENLPAFLLAENVKGLKPYISVLVYEFEKRGYTAKIQLYNSKFWNVPQKRERYFIVATKKELGEYVFPNEQHEYIPNLSDALDEKVDKKYYISDEKAQLIVLQALERLVELGRVHACITPDRIKRRQNGRRAKEPEEEMFTLTAQDIHGVIIKEEQKVDKSAFTYISNRLIDFINKKGYIPHYFNPYNCADCGEQAPTVTTACGVTTTSSTVLVISVDDKKPQPVIVQLPHGFNKGGLHEIAPTITTSGYQYNNYVVEGLLELQKIITADPSKAAELIGDAMPILVIDDTYGFDDHVRIYIGASPTLRAGRYGLKVLEAGCNITEDRSQRIRVYNISNFKVRKLTPKEYGRLQAFPVDDKWEQVVTDSQAYHQFGNAVTVTVAEGIGKSLYHFLEETEMII